MSGNGRQERAEAGERARTEPAPEPAAGARAFHRLHHGERPFLLPNAWDHASGAALAAHGFAAVGTTSLGVAAAAGLPDGEGVARDLTRALGCALARLPVPVSVDIEGGFADTPEAVAALAAELWRAGVAGVNIEDGRPDGTLTDPALHAAKVTAVKEAAPGLFVNARTDTHWLRADPTVRGALRRAETYAVAGADGVFVPGVSDEDTIAALTSALAVPLNVLHSPALPSFDRLAALGVARVSLGSSLFRAALGHAVATAAALAAGAGGAPATAPRWAGSGTGVPPYADVQALAGHFA
ncbi:isocitrate lyase/PEP mutase family protein [Streptomyces daliensis]|uniref:Isocitrate lyase/phosphoenolpyruvate mutase family protein n=1 Tax=Streptomyces daliensis TaxID=299421 RepID=A0A8T4IR68_9ACTN|nr:isocitrate lyase/phosphoenolpyruvate mutase family protein [Streptomyces daliensis]